MATEYEMPPYHLDDENNTRMDMNRAPAAPASNKKQDMSPKDEIASVARSIMLSSNVAAGDRLEAARVYGRLHGVDLDAVSGGKNVLTED